MLSQIVPSAPDPDTGDGVCPHAAVAVPFGPEPIPRSRNYSWAQLMRRVFEIDVLECPQCGGPLRVLAAIQSPEAIRKILDCVGLPSRAPPIAPPAPDPDPQLEWA